MTTDEREAVKRGRSVLREAKAIGYRDYASIYQCGKGPFTLGDLRTLLRLAEQGASRTVEQKTRA